MRIAFIGDVVGKSGRQGATALVPRLRDRDRVDIIIANIENSAGGFGIHERGVKDLSAAGIDFFTTGNHVWDKVDGMRLLDSMDNIVRPANYPGDAPGVGSAVVPGTDGRLAVINVQGRVFMPPLDCPFRTVDAELASLPESVTMVVVDMHAEATSEKIAMGWYLDGRVSLVAGTHTHVPTRDTRVLPAGTAYVTDVGMTGSYDSILGVKKEAVIGRFLSQRPTRFEVARADVRCDYLIVDIDEKSGRANSIEHPQYRLEE